MPEIDEFTDVVREQFIEVAHRVSCSFPELDLRFSLKSGTHQLRFVAADVSDEIYEIELGVDETEILVMDAILTIKEVARLFDD